MISLVVPLVIAFAVNPRIVVTSRDNQIEKWLKLRTKPRRTVLTLPRFYF